MTMKNNVYVPEEHIPDFRQTCFVQRGRIWFGGKMLAKGDSWGMDMTLDGHWRLRLTGISKNFSATLSLAYHDLERVLVDYPYDRWQVVRVSTHLAMRRHLKHLAEKVNKHAEGCMSLMDAVNTFHPPLHGDVVSLVSHRDDLAYVVKVVKDSSNNVSIMQGQINARQAAVDGRLERLESRFDGLDSRIGGLEGQMAEAIGLLNSVVAAMCPSNPSDNGSLSVARQSSIKGNRRSQLARQLSYQS
jgi:hypothetical protein